MSVSVDVDVGVGAIEWKGDFWTTVVKEDQVQASAGMVVTVDNGQRNFNALCKCFGLKRLV